MKAKSIHAAPLLLTIVFICTFGASLLPADIMGTDTDPYIAASLMQLFIMAFPAVIFCRLRGGDYMKGLRLRMFSVGHIGFMIFALLFIFFGSSGINYLMYNLFPNSGVAVSYESSGGFAGGLYLVLTMAVIPAITEEFLFRSIIVSEYESVSITAAVFMSSLTFAMLHFNFARLPVYIFCGLVLVLVLYTTGSVFAAMTVHMANNIATLFFGDLVYKVVTGQGVVLFCFMLLTLIIVSAILMFGECEKIYYNYSISDKDSSYAKPKVKLSGIGGILYSMFTPIFTVLAVIYIIIAAVKL